MLSFLTEAKSLAVHKIGRVNVAALSLVGTNANLTTPSSGTANELGLSSTNEDAHASNFPLVMEHEEIIGAPAGSPVSSQSQYVSLLPLTLVNVRTQSDMEPDAMFFFYCWLQAVHIEPGVRKQVLRD
jgi:hypothetical protein